MAFPLRNGSPTAARRRLRELMSAPDVVPLPGAYDALSALLLKRLGFEGLWAGGKVGSAVTLGVGDLGLMTMTEQLHFCTSLADATGLPVIADADDGYGGVLQVARTVQSFERAGVAAIVLEDQAAPKHCAFYEDFPLELIDADQMVAKLSMALDARLDQTTMIWARSDALAAGHGVDETLERLHAYGSTGVDAIFVPCNDMAALAEYASRWDGPAQLVVSGTAFPHMTLDDAKKLGFAAKLDPSAPVLAALRGMEEVMAEYRRTGSLEHARARSKTSRDFEEIIETSIAADMDRRHSPTRQPAAPKSSG